MKKMIELDDVVVAKTSLTGKWAIGEVTVDEYGATYFKWKVYIPDEVIKLIKNDNEKEVDDRVG